MTVVVAVAGPAGEGTTVTASRVTGWSGPSAGECDSEQRANGSSPADSPANPRSTSSAISTQ
ncbi:MAG: hypothetical protein JST59_21850 [Actinobacteria bacterium]|nr:hypothetical protein [Actinomycetota bacterium]